MNATNHAVIFDMDGVLVDSEVIAAQIESELFAEMGATITVEDIYEHFVGLSDAAVTEALERHWSIQLPEWYRTTRLERIFERFEAEGSSIAGIETVLTDLTNAQRPIAVASSSRPASIEHKLAVTGLDRYFADHVYSATLVDRAKPAPDLFLHTAERLTVDPPSCIVVEDSMTGVRAGKAAGMVVIGFTAGGHCGTDHAERLLRAGADHVTTDATGLSALLTDRC